MNNKQHTLIIVESPNKCKTISQFLGSDYTVVASVGHICSIANSGKYNMGINTENDFAADFQIDPEKRDIVKKLKELVKLADRVVLATDADNEGEAISYHLKNFLKIPDSKYDRVTFHEITQKVVMEGLANPRKINENQAISAITRAINDKLIGFRVSPITMTKVECKSAGRVQSAGLKILAIRENEIKNFIPETFYEIWLPFIKNSKEYRAQYKGTDKKKMVSIQNKETAEKIISDCKDNKYILKNIESKDRNIPSKLPFTTSTFQQEVSTKLGYPTKKAMEAAQKLFEGIEVGGKHIGLITYLRTDSTYMNEEFCESLAEYVKNTYGKKYYAPVKKGKKDKNVQDAHECIRPVDLEMTPEKLKTYINDPQLVKVYKIIYDRTVSAAMSDCIMTDTEYSIYNGNHRFAYTTHDIKFDGFKKVYKYVEDDEDDTKYPVLKLNEVLKTKKLDLVEKQTSAPSRYTEATFVKKLDESGIGRPSTTANTLAILLDKDRGYVEKDGKYLVVTDKGLKLSGFLDKNFGDIINLTYTAEMEADLDKIAEGKLNNIEFLRGFYEKLCADIEIARSSESLKDTKYVEGRTCPNCGGKLLYREGKYGKFIGCEAYPKCKYVEKDPSKPVEKKEEAKKTGIMCPDCGSEIVIRKNKSGQLFYACSGYPAHKRIFTELEFRKLVEKAGTSSKSVG